MKITYTFDDIKDLVTLDLQKKGLFDSDKQNGHLEVFNNLKEYRVVPTAIEYIAVIEDKKPEEKPYKAGSWKENE